MTPRLGGTWLAAGIAATAACAAPRPRAPDASERAPVQAPTGALPARPAFAPPSVALVAPASDPVPPAPSLPEGVVAGALDVLSAPGGPHRIRVIHAAASTRRALVYLHGMCGDVHAPEEWADVVSAYATLVAIEGEVYCGRAGRFKWSRDVAALDRRIDEALALVRERRGGLLDVERIAVMGYSQGATRAAMLTALAPQKYPWVVVAGIPATPRVDRVGLGEVIAVLGGEHEPTKHMKDGVRLLTEAGRTVRYFHLPGAEHGQYGPDGPRVLGEVFDFVLRGGGAGASGSPRGG